MLFFFFFFKQKTAYEMRMSDWSSDVCSSDLLVEQNIEELARTLSSEHGKVIADARGDVQRGLDVIEFACGIPHALKGEYTQGAGPGIDVYSMRQPIGIGAGITPFNFPAMIPMWM